MATYLILDHEGSVVNTIEAEEYFVAARWPGLYRLVELESVHPDNSDLLKANNDAYSANTLALTADYPQLEKDTWPTQDGESAAWVADPDGADTPWVDQAAAERGMDREEYLRRTLVKSKQFKILSSFLTGRRQRFEDAIKAGQAPVLDYALTPGVQLQLQQAAADGMNLRVDQLRGSISARAQPTDFQENE